MTSDPNSMVFPPSLGPRMQLGFVVPDLDDAMAYWTRELRTGPFVVIEDPVGDTVLTHRGRPSKVSMSVAFTYIGDVMVELLVQTNDAPSAYREFLDQGRSGLHHLGFWPPAFDQAVRDLEIAGFEEVTSLTTAEGKKAFAYYETPPHIGIMFEIVPMTDARRIYYGAIQRLASSWDGLRPVRRYRSYSEFMSSADCNS